MKTCPFCAEEIQDDAIKCKHCKEWLKKDAGEEKGEFEQALDERAKETTPTPNKAFNEFMEDDDDSKYRPLKKKLGWGQWVLLFCMSTIYHSMTVKPNAFSGAVMLILPFAIYFGLRTRMIGFFSKLWKASFVAGLIALLSSSFIVGFLMEMGL